MSNVLVLFSVVLCTNDTGGHKESCFRHFITKKSAFNLFSDKGGKWPLQADFYWFSFTLQRGKMGAGRVCVCVCLEREKGQHTHPYSLCQSEQHYTVVFVCVLG